MKLLELFDKPLPWEMTDKESDYVEYEFKVEDLGLYRVEFSDIGEEGDNEWEMLFTAITDTGPSLEDIIGTKGKQIQIFSTIHSITQHFLHMNKVDILTFSAKQPSRAKLYRRFARMMGDYEEKPVKDSDSGTSLGTEFSVRV